jgi:hypothetical protein
MTDTNDTNDRRREGRSMPMPGRTRQRGGDRPDDMHDARTTTSCVDATVCRFSSFLDDVEAAA